MLLRVSAKRDPPLIFPVAFDPGNTHSAGRPKKAMTFDSPLVVSPADYLISESMLIVSTVPWALADSIRRREVMAARPSVLPGFQTALRK